MLTGADMRATGIHPLAFALVCFSSAGLWVGFFKLLAFALRLVGGVL